jgi:hypothetical protein
MPWEIKESNNEYCVHKAGESDPLKCYSSKGEAEDYMKALYANSPDTHNSDFLLDEYVATRPGDPYRLLPFGVIIKNGNRREITPEYAKQFKLPHFKPPIKLGNHDDTTPAGGHILRLEVRADGLYAIPELNDKGAQAILDGAYRYQSPEVIWEGGSLEDPTTGDPIEGPLIVGDALLHTPHLGEAAALYTIQPIQGVNTMPEDTVQVPKSIFDVFTSWFKRNTEPKPEPEHVEAPEPVIPDEFKAAVAERDQYKAQVEAMQAEASKKVRVDKFATALKETKAGIKAEMLASMTDDQANAVVTELKALSAQIAANDALTHEVGTANEADLSIDPQVNYDAQIKALAAEKKITYPAAAVQFAVAHPDLFGSKEK